MKALALAELARRPGPTPATHPPARGPLADALRAASPTSARCGLTGFWRRATAGELGPRPLALADLLEAVVIRDAVERIGGLLPILERGDPADRASFYEAVDLRGECDPRRMPWQWRRVCLRFVSEERLEPFPHTLAITADVG